MRISQLSQRSGISVASIKYYLREGLLPSGESISATSARYGERHLARLRLIRALLEVGGLSIAATRDVIAAIDDGEHAARPVDDTVRQALHALGPAPAERGADAEFDTARWEVAEYVAGLDWQVDQAAPALGLVAEALVTLRRSVGHAPVEILGPYAETAYRLAEHEFATRPTTSDLATTLEWAMTGTVVFERVLLALRRLAHNAVATSRAAAPPARSAGEPVAVKTERDPGVQRHRRHRA